jgi:protein TonB
VFVVSHKAADNHASRGHALAPRIQCRYLFLIIFMIENPALELRSRNAALLAWCVAGSALAHVLMLTMLPGWSITRNRPPLPLTVELREPPVPEIVPPKPLPMEPRSVPQERPKPMPVKRVVSLRDEQPVVQPRPAPILTAPPEVPMSSAPVVPEQRPVPPPAQSTEVARPPPAPVAAPVTLPRSDAAYLNNPRPAYPLAARRRGDQGTVLVRVLVSADGLAASTSLEKTSGHPALDEAALTAVKSWRFVPARQGGQAIESLYTVPIVFKVE